jgi:hypothetical protein
MDAEEFINIIKRAVHDSCINGLIKTFESPSGSEPHPKVLKISKWYNSFDEEQKEIIKDIITQSVHASIFDLLCVIDGVLPVSAGGEFELSFVEGDKEYRLNNPDEGFLHDLYQAEVWEEVFL